MKALFYPLFLASILGVCPTYAAQGDDPTSTNQPPAKVEDADPGETNQPPAVVEPPAEPLETAAARPADDTTPAVVPAPAKDAGSGEARPAGASSPNALETPMLPDGTKGLRLNFRGAPLEMVLNYLSEAAGFIINLETEVRGKVDVWSNQPLTKDEALTLLDSVLNKNGYAAIRSGRTLTIISRDEAKKRDIPVVSGNDPQAIPKSDEVVTQIIPVRFINALQVSKDLQALLPTTANLTANEGGNALVLTDTRTNIRRMAEIVKALDTAIASVSSIRVHILKYADAKALATLIKDLFTAQDSSSQRGGGQNQMQQFFRGMRGGGGQDAGAGSGGSARVATSKVIAVADERSNAIVVSAPEDQMTVIEDVIQQVDRDVEDITELRVFRLKFADPQETADLLASLFSDTGSTTGTSQGGGRGQIQFGGRFGGAGGGFGNLGAASSASQSARLQKQTKVVAVADLRTGSVVVSASRDLMTQIGKMLEQLDSDPRRKQKVFVYSVENGDPQAVQDVIQSLFPSQGNSSTSSRNSSQQNANQLNNRQTQTRNQSRSGTGSTSSGFGSSTGGR
jgi:type II secretory pathway component GspD/PulD (secretin)